jgi:hypothetical protein
VQSQLSAEEEIEALTFPWDAVQSKVTKDDYYRDSRWFLEFAGFVDPKRTHHKPGPQLAMKRQREAMEAGMVAFIQSSKDNPGQTKLQILRFIRAMNASVQKGETGATELRRRLTPIKLALEINEVPLAWKKIMRLLPPEEEPGQGIQVRGYQTARR